MVRGWTQRVESILGVCVLTGIAVIIANHPLVQRVLTEVIPVLNRLGPTILTNGSLTLAYLTSLVVILGALAPLYKPRPRRILDTITLTQRRVLLAGFVLAAIGYFDYTYRLPRPTLLLVIGVLVLVLPWWFVVIRTRPRTVDERAVIIGDDPHEIERIVETTSIPIIGYVSPSIVRAGDDPQVLATTDGGERITTPLEGVPRLGDLSQVESLLIEENVGTALFAFAEPNRGAFFSALATCHDNGIQTKIHRANADAVLISKAAGEELVDIDLEPWDWQDRAVKRTFDIAFAALGLLILAPIIVASAIAIKVDSDGPILYSQERTTEFGDTFGVYKFRSMVQNAEAKSGAVISEEDAGGRDPRVTRVGRILRRTHMDEIPQLWSILVGDMSVVGPRPERPALETDIQSEIETWQQRWFVKPGLTGLAQVHDVSGANPQEKIRYDIEYIRKQSFWFDVKIVIRQIWSVMVDVRELVS